METKKKCCLGNENGRDPSTFCRFLPKSHRVGELLLLDPFIFKTMLWNSFWKRKKNTWEFNDIANRPTMQETKSIVKGFYLIWSHRQLWVDICFLRSVNRKCVWGSFADEIVKQWGLWQWKNLSLIVSYTFFAFSSQTCSHRSYNYIINSFNRNKYFKTSLNGEK